MVSSIFDVVYLASCF